MAAKGWRVSGTKEFLALSAQEAAYIELKLKLAEALRAKRLKRHLGQTGLAKLVRSSQSRVAKMEAAHPSVSLELLVRALLATGMTMAEIGAVVSTGDPDAAPEGRRAASKRGKRRRRATEAK